MARCGVCPRGLSGILLVVQGASKLVNMLAPLLHNLSPSLPCPLHSYLGLGGEVASSSPASPFGVDLRSESTNVGNELVVGSSDNTSLAVPQQLPGKCQKREKPELETSGLLPRDPLNIYGISSPGFYAHC